MSDAYQITIMRHWVFPYQIVGAMKFPDGNAIYTRENTRPLSGLIDFGLGSVGDGDYPLEYIAVDGEDEPVPALVVPGRHDIVITGGTSPWLRLAGSIAVGTMRVDDRVTGGPAAFEKWFRYGVGSVYHIKQAGRPVMVRVRSRPYQEVGG
jgi:hypothetical protein